eukprot:12896136-Prorocentrum_lima.AAC.1
MSCARSLLKPCAGRAAGPGLVQQRRRALAGKFPGVGNELSRYHLSPISHAENAQLAWLFRARADQPGD